MRVYTAHSVMSHFVTPWTVAHQAPLAMELSRQGYWSGLPFPPPRDLPSSQSQNAPIRWATNSHHSIWTLIGWMTTGLDFCWLPKMFSNVALPLSQSLSASSVHWQDKGTIFPSSCLCCASKIVSAHFFLSLSKDRISPLLPEANFSISSSTLLHPATRTMLLHPYPASLASLVSSKCFSSVLWLANILGAHLFPAPTSSVSWKTPSSQNPVEVFYGMSPRNPKLPFVKSTTNTMGCSLSHLVPNTSSSHPPPHSLSFLLSHMSSLCMFSWESYSPKD